MAVATVLSGPRVPTRQSRTPFHRGGLTESEPSSVKGEHDKGHTTHSTFPEFYNDPTGLVWSPAVETNTPYGDHAYAAVKRMWCQDETDILAECQDDYGTPNYHHSVQQSN